MRSWKALSPCYYVHENSSLNGFCFCRSFYGRSQLFFWLVSVKKRFHEWNISTVFDRWTLVCMVSIKCRCLQGIFMWLVASQSAELCGLGHICLFVALAGYLIIFSDSSSLKIFQCTMSKGYQSTQLEFTHCFNMLWSIVPSLYGLIPHYFLIQGATLSY